MINVNVLVEKKARKWFQVIDLNNDSSAQLLIDENTKDFVTGKEYTFAADIEDKSDRKYGKVEMTYVSESISEESSKKNAVVAINEAKNEAIENLTHFVAYRYIVWANDYISKRELKRLNAIVAEFELSDEDNAKIDKAWALYNERMDEMSAIEASRLEASDIRDRREEEKRNVIADLRATGDDATADFAELVIDTKSRYFEHTLANYTKKVEPEPAEPTLESLEEKYSKAGHEAKIVYSNTFNAYYLVIDKIEFKDQFLALGALTTRKILDTSRIDKVLEQIKLLREGKRVGALDKYDFDCLMGCEDVERRARDIAERADLEKSKYILKHFGGLA